MIRIGLVLGSVAMLANAATAQGPVQSFPGYQYGIGPAFNPNNFMPNIFNPQTQPLSPYLNLLRGSNPGVDYFFGVRPGTIGLGGRSFGGAPFVAPGGNRTVFFPQLANAPEPTAGTPGPGQVLPPAGHPVVFGNTMGYFPGAGGQAGGSQPGLKGLGTTPPPARKN
jgi:hypothetical protein